MPRDSSTTGRRSTLFSDVPSVVRIGDSDSDSDRSRSASSKELKKLLKKILKTSEKKDREAELKKLREDWDNIYESGQFLETLEELKKKNNLAEDTLQDFQEKLPRLISAALKLGTGLDSYDRNNLAANIAELFQDKAEELEKQKTEQDAKEKELKEKEEKLEESQTEIKEQQEELKKSKEELASREKALEERSSELENFPRETDTPQEQNNDLTRNQNREDDQFSYQNNNDEEKQFQQSSILSNSNHSPDYYEEDKINRLETIRQNFIRQKAEQNVPAKKSYPLLNIISIVGLAVAATAATVLGIGSGAIDKIPFSIGKIGIAAAGIVGAAVAGVSQFAKSLSKTDYLDNQRPEKVKKEAVRVSKNIEKITTPAIFRSSNYAQEISHVSENNNLIPDAKKRDDQSIQQIIR